MNMKGTWLTSLALAEAPAKPPQKSQMNHLKILSGQRICTHKLSALELFDSHERAQRAK